MMRARVLAQGFTIAVLAVGSFYNLQIKPSQQLALAHQVQQHWQDEQQLQQDETSGTRYGSSGSGFRRV